MTTKDKLLAFLKQNQHKWISGEQLSDRLGISRSAIWKHMRSLKQEGYTIQSAPKKGYCLDQVSDLLLPAEIQDQLQTHIMGRPQLVCLKETDSTNLQAKALAANGASEGTVVVAELQTHGRGRRGRSWFSPKGHNIYTSLILRPPMAPAQAPQITLMTAVAVARTLREAGLDAMIKWPNDILIQGKKIAGILTEISTDMDVVDYVVVGLGLNVNTPAEQIPEDIKDIATSAVIESGRRFSRVELLCAFLQNFEASYEQLKHEGFDPIMAQWRQMTDIIGQQVNVDVMDKRFTGRVEDVDNDGVLIFRDDENQLHRIFSGDVTRVRPKGI